MATSSILVPLDGSQSAENALGLASRFGAAFGHPLRVIHIADPHQSSEELKPATERFVAYGEALAKRLGVPTTGTSFEVFAGNAAEMISALAEDAAFVVIASHGRGGFRAMFMGSVADKVVRTSHAPVIVVPAVGDAPGAPTKLMVALDGSDEAELALGPARQIAAAFGAELILLRAFNPAPPVTTEFGVYPPELPAMLEEETKSYLASVAKPGEGTVIAMGDAASALVDSAKEVDADFVVMTSSGKGAAKRFVIGSTTSRVMHSLHRTIMVIPHRGD